MGSVLGSLIRCHVTFCSFYYDGPPWDWLHSHGSSFCNLGLLHAYPSMPLRYVYAWLPSIEPLILLVHGVWVHGISFIYQFKLRVYYLASSTYMPPCVGLVCLYHAYKIWVFVLSGYVLAELTIACGSNPDCSSIYISHMIPVLVTYMTLWGSSLVAHDSIWFHI